MTHFLKHAVVIGIDDYGAGISRLRNAVNDANAVARVLEESQGYDSVRLLANGEATREGILEALGEGLRRRVQGKGAHQPSATGSIEDGEADLEVAVVVYFAGHGFATGEGNEHAEYFVPHGAREDDRRGWLPMSDVHEALGRLRCRHLLVILDCCFAGAFRRAASRSLLPADLPFYQSAYDRYLDGKAWQILTSAAEDELAQDASFEHRDRRGKGEGSDNSPFARALLRGLRGKADSERGDHGKDGVITATELFQFIDDELRGEGRATQTPGLYPFDPTDLQNKREFVFSNPEEPRNLQPNPELDETNNPWRGLEAYSESTSALFFGREAAVSEILDLLGPEGPPWITLVGASGTGKSSLARAGILPHLGPDALAPDAGIRADVEALRGFRKIMAPRIQRRSVLWPRSALDDIRGAEDGLVPLIFLDQFEELFTRLSDERARRAYIRQLELLVENGARLLVTLRSDFEPQLERYASIEQAYQRGRYLVPRFERSELRAIIERPAIAKALYFDPESLVDELVDEVHGNANALPMLSFTLAEVYRKACRRRQATGELDRALKQADYAELGGVTGSVRRCTLDLFEKQDAAHRDTIRRLFLRLVTRDGNRLARRRVDERELMFGPRGPEPKRRWSGRTHEAWQEQKRVDAMLELFREARLISIEGGHVEPAHDSLVTGWEQTEAWLSEFGYAKLIRQLWEKATEWDDVRTPLTIPRYASRWDPRRWWAFGLRHWNAIRQLWLIEPSIPLLVSRKMRRELNWLETRFVTASWRWFRFVFWAAASAVLALVVSLLALLGYAVVETHRAERRALEVEHQQQIADRARRRALDRTRLLIARKLAETRAVDSALILLESENLGRDRRDDREIFQYIHQQWRLGELGASFPIEPIATFDWTGSFEPRQPPWIPASPLCRPPAPFGPTWLISLSEGGTLMVQDMDGISIRWRISEGWSRPEPGVVPRPPFENLTLGADPAGDRSILRPDGRVVVPESETGAELELPGRYRWALLGPSREYVATLDIDRRLRLWPLSARALAHSLRPRTTRCLDGSIRLEQLDETPEEARRATLVCLGSRPLHHPLRFTLGEETWKKRSSQNS